MVCVFKHYYFIITHKNVQAVLLNMLYGELRRACAVGGMRLCLRVKNPEKKMNVMTEKKTFVNS